MVVEIRTIIIIIKTAKGDGSVKKIALFDLDGTLVDSMSRFSAGLFTILDENGIEYDRDEMINIITPLGYIKSAEYFISLGVKGTVDELVDKMGKNLVDEYSNNIMLKPYVKEFLLKLKSDGYSLNVLTASPHLVTDPCLKNNEVYDLFDKIWSVEDYGMSKSNIEIFYKAAENMNCEPSDVLYFEDNVTAVINSTKAGYKTVAVKDNQTAEDIDEIKRTASKYIESFKEML